jgi:hypothetical protein
MHYSVEIQAVLIGKLEFWAVKSHKNWRDLICLETFFFVLLNLSTSWLKLKRDALKGSL